MYTNTRIMFFLVWTSFLLNSVHVLCGQSDSLVLGCGLVDSGIDTNGREWVADSKYINANNSITMRVESHDSFESEIPYMTTRIFTSEATYKFLVKADKRYWLRLYFYPAVYGKFNARDSYFSVIANGLTLLKNFSASITCQALSQFYIVREYSLAPWNLETLSVIFKPSAGSFAFVNGIEVIQIPDLFNSAKMVGSSEQIDISSYHSQTMYRLNVGGQPIYPMNDSGLTRTWYDDTPYIFGSQLGTTNGASPNVKIQYQGVPKYVAPVDVYSSSRSMGIMKRINLNFNLTWVFDVDYNSTYILRFHFCEFYYSKPNQLVFSIFVNNQTAEPTADVIVWSGGKGMPTYQDYMIYLSDVSGDQKLWVALHPSTELNPEFFDATLSGLEIFKISDTTGSLAGLNPQPSAILLDAENVVQSSSKKSKTSNVTVIGGAVGGAVAFGIVAALCIVYLQKKRVHCCTPGKA